MVVTGGESLVERTCVVIIIRYACDNSGVMNIWGLVGSFVGKPYIMITAKGYNEYGDYFTSNVLCLYWVLTI